jgi:hypothetical protein
MIDIGMTITFSNASKLLGEEIMSSRTKDALSDNSQTTALAYMITLPFFAKQKLQIR